MPPEVATAFLSTPGAHITNRMRKVYRAARAKVFVSTLEKKPLEVKLTGSMSHKTHLQLHKILRRARTRRWGLQKRYEVVQAMTPPDGCNEAAFQRKQKQTLAALDIAAAGEDILIEASESALAGRLEKKS